MQIEHELKREIVLRCLPLVVGAHVPINKWRTIYQYRLFGVDVSSQIKTLRKHKLVTTYPSLSVTAKGKASLTKEGKEFVETINASGHAGVDAG